MFSLFQRLIPVLSVVILAQSILIYMMLSETNTQPRFSVSFEGGMQIMNYFRAPIKSKEDVHEWASMVASMAMSLNFNQYQSQLTKVKQFFTDQGWQKFQESLSNSGYLDEIKEQKLYITAINNKSPMIPRWGYLNGEIYWSVQVPLALSVQSASQTQKKNRMVTMLVKIRNPVIADNNGCGYMEVINYLKKDLTIAEMYSKGCRVKAFRSAGILDSDLLSAGFTMQQLQSQEGNGLNPMVIDSFVAK